MQEKLNPASQLLTDLLKIISDYGEDMGEIAQLDLLRDIVNLIHEHPKKDVKPIKYYEDELKELFSAPMQTVDVLDKLKNLIKNTGMVPMDFENRKEVKGIITKRKNGIKYFAYIEGESYLPYSSNSYSKSLDYILRVCEENNYKLKQITLIKL